MVCDFEDPKICGYVQDRTDNFDWTRQTGQTSSTSTGPFADHTYGTRQGEFIRVYLRLGWGWGRGQITLTVLDRPVPHLQDCLLTIHMASDKVSLSGST